MSDTGWQREVDRVIYEQELKPWLPAEFVDIHVHVGLEQQAGCIDDQRRSELWPLDVGVWQSWDDLRHVYHRLFPGHDVGCLAFGGVYREIDSSLANAYVKEGISDPVNNAHGLFITRAQWPADVIETALSEGFVGIKPYPDLAPSGDSECSIFEFLPHSHLRVLDAFEGIVMLHLPRRGRLADPDNVRELLDIHGTYPRIRLILAHIGRAYCLETARKGMPYFEDQCGILFDTSANLNADVFQYALETVGPSRLLFGSDLPIMLMRGAREHIGEKYVNYTDGDYLWNKQRKSPDEESKYTYYLYQELKALIYAVQRAGFGLRDFHHIMRDNAFELLDHSAGVRASRDCEAEERVQV